MENLDCTHFSWKKKEKSFIMSTVEFTTFAEKYTVNVLAASICFDLVNNQSLSSIVLALDKNLALTAGFSLNKLASSYSTWSLNMIQNLFMYGTCTSSTRSINTQDNSIKSFKAFSFVLYYPPEGDCYASSMESILNYKNGSDEFAQIINTLLMKKFKNNLLIFDDYNVHRSTNIESPLLLLMLINTVLDSIKYSSNTLLAENIRKKLGEYWNVIVNQFVFNLCQISVISSKNFLKIRSGRA
jgi:hypothetical protein